MIVPELTKFNIECNVNPQPLHGSVLSIMQRKINAAARLCHDIARQIDIQVLMTDILPTLREQDLTLNNMSNSLRFRALNE